MRRCTKLSGAGLATRLDVRFAPAESAGAALGESPFWDHGDFVWWVDITGRKLLRTRISTGETRFWATPETPGFVVLTAPGRPVVGMETGIFFFAPDGNRFDKIVAFDAVGQRFNDATVDGRGRLWASTMAMDAQPGRGALHLVADNLTLKPVLRDLTIPNGLAADMEGGRLFLSDSHPDVQTVWCADCDFQIGSVGARAEFASTRALAGRPDGATLGSDGRYWIAGVDGSALFGFSSKGILEFEVPVPFAAPTKLTFVGGGVAVTSKGYDAKGGHLAIAMETIPPFCGPPVPFWRPGGSQGISVQ